MKNLIVKTFVVTILLLLPYIGISNAVYLDEEKSAGNSFSADSLDFELRDMNNNLIIENLFDQKIKKDEEIEKKAKVVKTGSLSFYYFAEFIFKTGDEDVCSEVNLKVKKDDHEVFAGNLSDFDLSSESAQLTGAEDVWSFTLKNENTDTALQGENCEFDIRFSAYQMSLNTGFSDVEKLSSNIIFPYEPTISLVHDTTLYKLILNLGNLQNFLSFDYVLDYDTDTIKDHLDESVPLSGENTKTIEIDLGSESDGVIYPYSNPHNFKLNIEFMDINNETISYLEEL
jgi:hypothetical protein